MGVWKSFLRLVLPVFLIFTPNGLNASSYLGNSFRSVPGNEGLSQASVYCMLQDHLGFVWIGTKDGLNRFDGYEFITYKYNQNDTNSLSNNEITCLESEREKFLWIGTRSGGVNRLELATGHITRFNNLTYDDLVQCVVLDSLNHLWAGTSEGLLLFTAGAKGTRDKVINVSKKALYYDSRGNVMDPDRNNIPINTVLELKKGLLLVGCKEGLFFYDIRKGSFFSLSEETKDVSVITSLKQDADGNIWAGSYDGLLKILNWDHTHGYIQVVPFNTTASANKRIPVDWVEDIVIDHENNVWAGTRGAGLVCISNDKVVAHYSDQQNVSFFIPDNLINSLMIDRTGVLWVGTESKGLAYADLFLNSFKIIYPGKELINALSDNLVTAMDGNDSHLWVGTAGQGIDIFAHQQGNLIRKKNIPRVKINKWESSHEVMSLLVDRHNNLWIGSATNSLSVFNDKGFMQSFEVFGFVFSLFEDQEGRIWYGTWEHGLGYVDLRDGGVERYYGSATESLGLSSDKVLSIMEDSNNLLWIGTKGGGINVCRRENVVKRNGEFVCYKNDPSDLNSLSYNDIYDIYEDSAGNIWVATGSGLNKVIHKENTSLDQAALQGTLLFESYSERDGLAGGLVLFIEEDDHGNLWLGTNKGISKFIPGKKSFINYGVNDGLPSGEFHINASFKDQSTGVMYFGGVNGIAYFHPDSLRFNPISPKVQITGIRVKNQPVFPGDTVNGKVILDKFISYSDHLVLAHKNNEVTFEFSALHFSNPEKHHYAYRLKGFNDSWQETSSANRRATYTNLHEGDYVFEVKATNFVGDWAETVASIPLTVNPPVWRTSMAYFFYFLLLVVLLVAFRKYSLIGVKEKNNLIIESIENKKDREISEAKMKFFTNISHEIRTPLTLIYGPLQEAIKRKDVSSDLYDSLMIMFRNVKRLLKMVDQLLEFRKLDAGHAKLIPVKFNLNELGKEILEAFKTLATQKGIKMTLEAKEDIYMVADEKMISTSIYNLLSNALKFTPQGGKVVLQFENVSAEKIKNDRNVVIRVCDTGPGIPKEWLPHVFDRFRQVGQKGHGHHGGSGIGLSIVKEFVELHNGQVHVFNCEERGCCFEIFLPIHIESEYNDDTSVALNPSGPKMVDSEMLPLRKQDNLSDEKVGALKMESQNGKTNICLVEDDVELASWLSATLGEKFKVNVFHNGDEALQKIPAVMPDMIICDIMLPGISGIELVHNFKSNIETSHIPVIMLTAKSKEDDMIKGLKTGADSYLTKPFNIDILNAQIDALLASRNAFKNKFSGKLLLEPSDEVITPLDEKFLNRLMEVTEEKMADPDFDVSVLVDEMNMSHSIILKKVKTLTGLSLVEFIRSMRIKKAAQIFRQDKLSVSEVSFMVGFSDPKYFSKCFSKQIGKKPSQYIKDIHG
ncbi:hybrid sensor histidine kinase/response regulator transcription factor [Thermophagus sp. OGC60D27]|uniref:hybrid sensor histidine kinase/response regulator transcription factor n=1 Tax=Thermophagus sp. OGC60D27 TaxID=3458415 RepID=UPI004037A5E3